MTTDQTPAPESARALLWRHGVPEDVIDGVLCLHAQELAAVIRSNPGAIPYRPQLDEDGGFWWDLRDRDAAADLIDPTRTAPAVSSVPPPADRAALRDRIAEALERADYRPDMRRGDLADAIMPVLPAPADRAAVLREAADIAESLRQFEPTYSVARSAAQVSENVGILRVADELRRMAAEEQPAETQGGFEPRGTAEIKASALDDAATALEAQSCTCGCRRGAEFLRQRSAVIRATADRGAAEDATP